MKFWMVYVEGNRLPQYKHDNWDKATAEAQRLSALNLGKRVYVLETSGFFLTAGTGWTSLKDDVPF